MSEQPVLTEAADGVLLITLNRPEARNAVNAAVAEGVAAALDRLDADDDLRVAILTGAGKGVLRGHGPEGVRGRRAARTSEGRGFAGIAQRAAARSRSSPRSRASRWPAASRSRWPAT